MECFYCTGEHNLYRLLQKSVRYKHNKENYIRSLAKGIMATGVHLNKKPAFEPVFEETWRTVLLTAEKDLVRLLFFESDSLI